MAPMATLGESPSAKILREALATVRRDALPTSPTVSPLTQSNQLSATTDPLLENNVWETSWLVEEQCT